MEPLLKSLGKKMVPQFITALLEHLCVVIQTDDELGVAGTFFGDDPAEAALINLEPEMSLNRRTLREQRTNECSRKTKVHCSHPEGEVRQIRKSFILRCLCFLLFRRFPF